MIKNAMRNMIVDEDAADVLSFFSETPPHLAANNPMDKMGKRIESRPSDNKDACFVVKPITESSVPITTADILDGCK